MNPERIYSDVRRKLEDWEGYAALAEAMRVFDDLSVYVAGGVVRNILAEKLAPPKDFDFFLAGRSVAAAVERIRRTGHMQTTPYGAPRWHPTAGRDCYADLMPINDFAPGLWPCEDIVDVLCQFDFTANSIAFDLRTGEAFDPLNGARDASRRVMKMVRFDYPSGPFLPGANIDRNAVLWFRVVHYASELGFTVEPLTRKWLLLHRHHLQQHKAFAKIFFQPNLRVLQTIDEQF